MNYPENTPWCEKYRVSSFEDVKGQDAAINVIKNFLRVFPKKRGIVLHGHPGTGKTSLAYAIAFSLDAEILELNASDLRNKKKIAAIIGPASLQKPLFKKQKIILVDEVDGISIVDRGGLGELLVLLEKSAFPIIITANDIWKQKFNLLRRKCEMVALKDVNYENISEILKKICVEEKCIVANNVIVSIAMKSKGDIRAAINDLQIISKMDSPSLITEIGERNKETSIFNALQYVFKNAQLDTKMLGIFDEVNLNIDQIFLWVEENIPLEYKTGRELFLAYDALSKADVFRGRIYRQQHWRFMVYEYFLLSGGIAAAKKYNRSGWTSYKKPTRILKIWLQNQRAKNKKTICQKYAKYTHISTKQAMKEFMLFRIILENKNIRVGLKLTQEEIDYLDKPIII